MNKSRFFVLTGMILTAVLSKFLPHPINFAPIGAIALFGGAQFTNRWIGFAVPFTALLIGDLITGLHTLIPFVYGCFALNVCLGWWVRRQTQVASIVGATLFGSVAFFLVTNFGVWLLLGTFEPTASGLMQCYAAGTPVFPEYNPRRLVLYHRAFREPRRSRMAVSQNAPGASDDFMTPTRHRIVSLLPSATEIACALGLADQLVGITHCCDHPKEQINGKPVVVRSALPIDEMSMSQIDAAVAERLRSGESLYLVNDTLLRELEPTLLLTQDLCQVCAPAGNEVSRALQAAHGQTTGHLDVSTFSGGHSVRYPGRRRGHRSFTGRHAARFHDGSARGKSS